MAMLPAPSRGWSGSLPAGSYGGQAGRYHATAAAGFAPPPPQKRRASGAPCRLERFAFHEPASPQHTGDADNPWPQQTDAEGFGENPGAACTLSA